MELFWHWGSQSFSCCTLLIDSLDQFSIAIFIFPIWLCKPALLWLLNLAYPPVQCLFSFSLFWSLRLVKSTRQIFSDSWQVLRICDILEHNGVCNDRSVIILLVFLCSQLLVKKSKVMLLSGISNNFLVTCLRLKVRVTLPGSAKLSQAHGLPLPNSQQKKVIHKLWSRN